MKVTRRHLLKGSLAAPLVMTVRSASATGMALSSAGACRVRDKDRAGDVYKFRPSKDSDEWLRCEVQICKLQQKNSRGQYVDVAGEYFKGNTGCYWKMTKVGADCTIEKHDTMTDANCRVKKVVRKEWGLVACDDQGNVKGFAWEQTSHSPITGSCWTSLTAG